MKAERHYDLVSADELEEARADALWLINLSLILAIFALASMAAVIASVWWFR